ncbi:hypothetical protein D9758_018360 [Tetrapyrgos nigripes]|uniref:L-tryptophan decarboxylase PsiD-like domain-containing protein n=1 Tax=Tetrapyrgos nigripes TaxID=182062 RepID=A0A8H5C3G7_9AGAR|nr:hypothetical protein D9758_018360 [Tetrapyrgos nigripes]
MRWQWSTTLLHAVAWLTLTSSGMATSPFSFSVRSDVNTSEIYPSTRLTRYGGWIPSPVVYNSFIHKHRVIASGRMSNGSAHIPAVAEFERAIKSDPVMTELWNQIFLQVSPLNQVPGFDGLLYMLDQVLVEPPSFHMARDAQGNIIQGESIGVPVYVLMDLLANTGAAHDLFRMPAYAAALKKMLNSWGTYLTSPDSNKTLTDDVEGWFGPTALASLQSADRGTFDSTYVVPNPNMTSRGFPSFDAFFTREVQDSARPILNPDDSSLIVSACESTVYRIAKNASLHDQFWLKAQHYSLYDMLNHDNDLATQFVGGTVYQAFLSPQDYHRWRSPVDGVISKVVIVPGTYYAALPDEGAPADDPDFPEGDPHGAAIRSQAWIAHSSARALIYIKSDNPKIGLMCFIGIGMGEVSTVDVTVKKGQQVKKGTELGMFHFGGSSHALLFGPQANITFADDVQLDTHHKVMSTIAQVS